MSTLPAGFRPFLSVVAPCFNEEQGLPLFHDRLSTACVAALGPGQDWEIVLVNDGSRDGTLETLRKLAIADPHVVVVSLARNFGHQIALTAGLSYCRGERILIIDADLQDPPELLGPMLRTMDATQADVVYGQRRRRPGETVFKKSSASLFYRLLKRMSDIELPVDTGDFRLMNRRTVEVLNSMPEQQRFIRGMIAWIGLRQVPFAYDRAPRAAGQTTYPFVKMLAFAVDAVTSFSVVPLRIASWCGVFVGILGLLGLIYTVGSWAAGSVVRGWTSMATIILLIGGVQLLVLGVFGEYLGRMYVEAKRRPLFVVDQVLTGSSIFAESETNSSIARSV